MIKKILILTLCIAMTVTALVGCGSSKTTESEEKKVTEVKKKDPLTLEDFDKRFKESSYYKNMTSDKNTKVKTKISDDKSKYTVTMTISGTKYKASLDYKDGKLTGKMEQNASGYLTYMIMNYFANDISQYFEQPRGVVDYMFSLVTDLGTVGDYDKYGLLITDNDISISLNNMDFSGYKVTALSLQDKAITTAIQSSNTDDTSSATIAGDNSVSISNGFISLTTNNSDKDVYELNIVALTKNKYDVEKAVYDTIIRIAGYYNNGDSKYMSDFLKSKDDLAKAKKSSDSNIEYLINDEERVNSVVKYNGFDKDEFKVYTLKINRKCVNPVASEESK